MGGLLQDIRFALRQLRHKPGFSIAAILVLALGLGANASIFSVINAVLLHPLPFPDSGRLVLLYERDVLPGEGKNIVSLRNFLDWEASSHSFAHMAAARENQFNLAGNGETFHPERLQGAICSSGLFAALGVQPMLGRTFSPEEDKPSARRVAVISYRLWQRRFGGSRDVLKQQIRLDSENYDIAGVMPPGFSYPTPDDEVWAPVEQIVNKPTLENRSSHQFYVVARLAPGVSIERARAELDGIQRRIFEHEKMGLIGRGAAVFPLNEEAVRRVRTSILVLFAAVACVLLISCVNIANLLLARASARQREIAIRMAIGANRGRIVRQLLTETLFLSAVAAACGLAIAAFLNDALSARAPELLNRGDIEIAAPIHVDVWVFAFTAVIAALAGISVGLAPALQAGRVDLNTRLKEGGRSSTSGRTQSRSRDALVASEVALSLILLVSAGLLLRSFLDVRSVSPGTRVDHLLTAGLSLPDARYANREQVAAFARALTARLRSIPGVQSAGLVTCLPAAGYCGDNAFFVEGRALPPGQYELALNRAATPEYFAAAGIPLLRGRTFTEQDGRGFDKEHPKESAAVISESMARKHWPNGQALDARIFFSDARNAPRYRIVGIVGDVRIDLDEREQPTFYLPLLEGAWTDFHVVVHTAGDPGAVTAAVRREVNALDADLPVYQIRPMEMVLERSAAHRRFTALLVAVFAAIALALAAIGVYAVLSYVVSQRTGEIGLRIVMGASSGDVHRLVLMQGMRPVIGGVLLGLIGAFGATRFLRALLFGVGAYDPATFIVVSSLLLLVAFAACWIPAYRAMRLDPAAALRVE